jgi:hypothetical protein
VRLSILENRDKLLAHAQTATGLGLLAFWALFFTVGMAPANPPACYFAFERAFPLPDGVLALGLLAAGILPATGRSWARVLTLPCAGALVFLGLLDFSFNLQNGIYASSLVDGVFAAAINLWCVSLGTVLTVAALGRGA